MCNLESAADFFYFFFQNSKTVTRVQRAGNRRATNSTGFGTGGDYATTHTNSAEGRAKW